MDERPYWSEDRLFAVSLENQFDLTKSRVLLNSDRRWRGCC